jgi:hypothetical protein
VVADTLEVVEVRAEDGGGSSDSPEDDSEALDHSHADVVSGT